MRKLILIILLPIAAEAQIDVRATISNTILNVGYGKGVNEEYFYGGSGFGSLSPGIEAEFRLKKLQYDKTDSAVISPKAFITTAIEAAVLYSSHAFIVNGYTSVFDPMASKLQVDVIQMPLIFKGNAHLSVLDENLRISLGLGVVNSYVLSQNLKESARAYSRDSKGNAIKDTSGNFIWVDYAAEANGTDAGPRFFTSFCLEFSISFKRLYVAERAWFGGRDMYMSGLAPGWGVPRSHSVYFNAYDTWSKVSYSGGAFTIGWKIN